MNDKRSTSVLLRSLPLALAVLACASTAGAQDDLQTQNDLAFARGLAVRFRYVDMAESVLVDVQGRGLAGKLREELDLVKCDVYAAGAKGEPEPEKRLELYDKAVEAYTDYIEEYVFSDFIPKAEKNYIELVNAYGQNVDRALDELLGDEAEALRDRSKSVLEDALDRVDDLIDALDPEVADPPLTRSQLNERYRQILYKSRMLLTLAKISEEGIFFFARCEDALEGLALEAGEQTFWGMNAYLMMAEAAYAQNNFEDAAAFGEYVVDSALPSDPDTRESSGWNELDPETRQRRWTLVENGTGGLIDALRNDGDTKNAARWALHFYNSWQREGFAITPRGYLALLAVSAALMDAGGYVGGARGEFTWFETEDEMNKAGFRSRRETRNSVDLALQVAQTVNEDNRGNVLQIQAQKLISEIIERPGIDPDPEVLFEAAQGEYYAKNYHAALNAFKRILRTLESQDEARQKEYGAAVLYHIGSSLDRMGRPLEAAMAFKDGVTTWRGDPEYDTKNAKGYYDTIGDIRRGATGDPKLEELWREAENLVVNIGQDDGGQGTIIFRQADRLYNDKDYDGARAKFLSIESGENVYEEAVSKAALCRYKTGSYDEATTEFQRYLEEYVPDPKNALTTNAKKNARLKARAQSTFYLGLIARSQGRWTDVVKWLGDFNDEFPSQTNYIPNALFMVVEAKLNVKDFEGAKKSFSVMRENFASHSKTGGAAIQVYRVLEQEQKAAEQAGDATKARDLKGQMAEYMNISNALATSPSFGNLRTESNLWRDLGDWARAEAALRSTLSSFGESADHATDIENYVKPDLGLAYLRQKKVPQAFEVLDTLIPDPDDKSDTRKPRAAVVANWCRSIAGWLEGDERNIVEVPGVGGAEKLEDTVTYWDKLANREKTSSGGWNCAWYELKLNLAYAQYQWGQVDSSKIISSMKTVKDLRDFSDPSLQPVADECGNDLVRRRLLWLWNKVQ